MVSTWGGDQGATTRPGRKGEPSQAHLYSKMPALRGERQLPTHSHEWVAVKSSPAQRWSLVDVLDKLAYLLIQFQNINPITTLRVIHARNLNCLGSILPEMHRCCCI